MTRVYVGMGSNIDSETNIRDGIHTLQEKFGELTISSVYESEPFGFEGDNFFNLVVGFDTTLNLETVASTLREIEFHRHPGECLGTAGGHRDPDTTVRDVLVRADSRSHPGRFG